VIPGHHDRRERDQRGIHEPVLCWVLFSGRGVPGFLPRADINPMGFNSRRPGASLAYIAPREASCFLRTLEHATPAARGAVVAL